MRLCRAPVRRSRSRAAHESPAGLPKPEIEAGWHIDAGKPGARAAVAEAEPHHPRAWKLPRPLAPARSLRAGAERSRGSRVRVETDRLPLRLTLGK
jgi:hypothetical protein